MKIQPVGRDILDDVVNSGDLDAGIRDVMIVTGGQYAGEFLRLVRDGREFGLHAVEESPLCGHISPPHNPENKDC